jgi:hypothetical protein
MASEVLLMLDNFIQSDLVLDKESDLDIELIDVLLSKLVLTNLVDNGLPQALEF